MEGWGGSMVVHQTVKPAVPGSNLASLQPAGTCHSLAKKIRKYQKDNKKIFIHFIIFGWSPPPALSYALIFDLYWLTACCVVSLPSGPWIPLFVLCIWPGIYVYLRIDVFCFVQRVYKLLGQFCYFQRWALAHESYYDPRFMIILVKRWIKHHHIKMLFRKTDLVFVK